MSKFKKGNIVKSNVMSDHVTTFLMVIEPKYKSADLFDGVTLLSLNDSDPEGVNSGYQKGDIYFGWNTPSFDISTYEELARFSKLEELDRNIRYNITKLWEILTDSGIYTLTEVYENNTSYTNVSYVEYKMTYIYKVQNWEIIINKINNYEVDFNFEDYCEDDILTIFSEILME